MRSKHLIVPVLLTLVACKGSADESKATKDRAARRATVTPQPTLPHDEVLPTDFPLPASSQKKLVRAQKKLTMLVWEYALPDVAPHDAAKHIEDAMRAGWSIGDIERAGTTTHLTATHGGRLYAVAVSPAEPGSSVAIRSFPETGPTTLNAPTSYPTKFPFLAGGTASHAPDGAKLTVAYQSDARDIEHAMIVAARAAGWQCSGTGTVTCTKDTSNVTFKTEPARGGSLLVVSAP